MMHVEVHEGRGPHLLLVHGLCSSRAQWRPNLAGLGRFATPVIVEVLGHGRSESPDDAAAYAVEAYIERFEALRERLGVERWAVCGQSFGAGLTMRYALERPERVFAQVFTNSNSALSPGEPPISEAARLARLAGFEERGRAALEALPFFPKRTGRLPPAVEDELLADAALISLAGVANGLRYTSPGLCVTLRLGEIDVPTLLVNGRRERRFQPLRDHAADAIPGVRIVDLDGGHPVNLDCADAFNGAVEAFLTGL
jgi:2-succinyl-6-hydroxy-2,4-cyclohexadiene-1-carboxylate synthase